MRSARAFSPMGPSVVVTAAAPAPTGLQVDPANLKDLESCQFRIMNNGTATIWYAFGIDAATANANAVIPTGGSNKDSYALPAGGIEVITAPRRSFFSAVIAAGTAAVYFTPGAGL